jgi:hypothetical protein
MAMIPRSEHNKGRTPASTTVYMPTESGGYEELGGVLEIVELGTGAELQRAALERSGSLVGMMDYLTKGTAPG